MRRDDLSDYLSAYSQGFMKQQNQPDIKLKRIQISYNIGHGDLDTKVRQAREHLGKGCRVKLEMRLKGRQNAHNDLALEMMEEAVQRLREGNEVRFLIERKPLVDGNNVIAQVRLK